MLSSPVFLKRVLLSAVVVAVAGALQADVKVPAIFSDHMVLQAADKVPVWGTADPAEAVTVTLGTSSASTKADAKGKWMLHLDLSKAGQGPHKMVVKGNNEIVIDDVLVGQVWLASGQSNMGWTLANTLDGKAEVAAGAGNWLREFRVGRGTLAKPTTNLKGKWVVGEANQTGSFSAVGYYFAKHLHQELKQPVGIINSTWGGTPSEAWTSAKGLAKDKELDAAQKRRNKQIADLPQTRATYIAQLDQWTKAHGLTDAVFAPAAAFAAPDADLSDWKKLRVSGNVTDKSLPREGVIWMRREVKIPKTAAGKNLTYRIQEPRGLATYYWNGERISGPEAWDAQEMDKQGGFGAIQSIRIPGKKVKQGVNVLAVRLYAPVQNPMRGSFRNEVLGASRFRQGLAGGYQWHVKAEKAFTPSAEVRKAAPKLFANPQSGEYQPSRLFNAMIAPVAPYGIAGVIWYQGEANALRAYQYRRAFPLLIEDWRAQWGDPQLPFYFCQLANFRSKSATPEESDWAELREAQNMALKLPYTGQAVLIDIGEAGDIHPRNKHDVGERLTRHALRNTYGHSSIVASGPVYEQNAVVGSTIYLKFLDDGPGSELVAKELPETYVLKNQNNTTEKLELPRPGSQLQGFAICGADGKWVWADAHIEGRHSVAVSSPEVPEPVAVRYAWANNPTCNLFNGAGLPASPFRTDDFAPVTLKAKY